MSFSINRRIIFYPFPLAINSIHSRSLASQPVHRHSLVVLLMYSLSVNLSFPCSSLNGWIVEYLHSFQLAVCSLCQYKYRNLLFLLIWNCCFYLLIVSNNSHSGKRTTYTKYKWMRGTIKYVVWSCYRHNALSYEWGFCLYTLLNEYVECGRRVLILLYYNNIKWLLIYWMRLCDYKCLCIKQRMFRYVIEKSEIPLHKNFLST